MVRVRFCATAVFVVATAMLAACGGGSTPISVSLSPSSPQEIDQGETAAIVATVMNDTSTKGVSWTLTGPGSLSDSTGPSVTYSPPTTNLTSSCLLYTSRCV